MKKQILLIEQKFLLRIPTGRRLTSWLFTKHGGVEFGTTEDKSIQWQGAGLEPGTSGLQVQRPNHLHTLASNIDCNIEIAR